MQVSLRCSCITFQQTDHLREKEDVHKSLHNVCTTSNNRSQNGNGCRIEFRQDSRGRSNGPLRKLLRLAVLTFSRSQITARTASRRHSPLPLLPQAVIVTARFLLTYNYLRLFLIISSLRSWNREYGFERTIISDAAHYNLLAFDP